ncbi:MAG: TonB-dependent receptor [Candidatus Eisenbacteria bacterium]|uniref:TonB-dependent receptor n=1 Tax=Eiseniibacteriota bacterium TaxID=2212470 RepID=A0A849SMX2_UNCEI|nr:TonB-dependent receptor [Candidatus Eisenbacteria bacterium]
MSPHALDLSRRLLLVACLFIAPGVASAATLRGRVVDRAGRAIEFANVQVPALKRGAVTDTEGRFTLELPDGPQVLEVSQIGYQRVRLNVAASVGTADLRVVLAEEPVPVAEVTVAASSFGKAGKSEGAVLRRIDVLTTPGGAADVFQALRALPGINAPNEGAAVYVRGGDPSETLIRVDSGELGHPYHYEGASGGLFSTIDSYMIKSAFFSSGGFSSKYGGALSGVLDVETQDPLDLRTVSLGANLAGMSASSSWALVPGKLSLIGSVSRSFPELLFRLYGSVSEYEAAPSSANLFSRLLWRPSAASRLSLSYLDSGDDVALHAEALNARELYVEHARNHTVALNGSALIGKQLALRGQMSGQYYRSRWSFGTLGASTTERNGQANLDAVWSASPRHEVSFGANLRRPATEIRGSFAADSTDIVSGAPSRQHDTDVTLMNPGLYLEDKVRVWGPVYATLGGRFDYASEPGVWTADPRGAVAWRIDDHQTARVAAGRYHQLADPRTLDPVYGNPDLEPLRADHVIAGYEWKSEFGNLRVEGYRKDYRGLLTTDSTRFFANDGHGFARGVDVFLQGTYRWLSGWVSYGYLDSRRREGDAGERVPSPYGVAHSITLVGQYHLNSATTLGFRYSASSGRPYTPVVGRFYDPGREVWHPVEGARQSANMPDYHRLDVRYSRLFSMPAWAALPQSGPCVVYVEGLNVLAIDNTLEYVYNSDYSRRYERDSYFSRRLLVAGFSLTW